MDKIKFDELWHNIVAPHIKNAVNRYKYRCDQTDDTKKAIFKGYEKSRSFFKSKKDTGLLDRHKIAASLMYSILDVKPFNIEMNVNRIKLNENLANEYLAIKSGISLISVFRMKYFKEKKKNEKLFLLWQDHKNIVFPPTDTGNDYLDHFMKVLHRIRTGDEEKSSLLPHCLFHIEKYYEYS